tara:strand:- start:2057 stop:2560 length:504 start_codon:yes stop_codon:yes gene_type:complete
MFTSYKKHNNRLYNNLVKLSRNKFFYQEALLDDKIENRVLLIFFHFALILYSSKGKNKEKEAQDIFDNIFKNIEYSLRELGEGDVAVNKKMKNLSRVFYDILVNFEKSNSTILDKNLYLLKKYFISDEKKVAANIEKLSDYFSKFKDFCFDLDTKNMLNGSFNFVYK